MVKKKHTQFVNNALMLLPMAWLPGPCLHACVAPKFFSTFWSSPPLKELQINKKKGKAAIGSAMQLTLPQNKELMFCWGVMGKANVAIFLLGPFLLIPSQCFFTDAIYIENGITLSLVHSGLKKEVLQSPYCEKHAFLGYLTLTNIIKCMTWYRTNYIFPLPTKW